MIANEDNGSNCSTRMQTLSEDDSSDGSATEYHMTVKMPQVSIYKLHTDRLGVNKDMSIEEIETTIKQQFEKKCYSMYKGNIKPFEILFFEYGSKIGKNKLHQAFEGELEPIIEAHNEGTKTSGTLIVWFRKLNDITPEIFCIGKGNAFSEIRKLADGTFRTKIAKCCLDETSLKKLKYVTISGPNTKVSRTNRAVGELDISFDAFERVYIELRGRIIQDCKLHQIISKPDYLARQFDIDIGQYKVKILFKLYLSQFCDILKHFSEVYQESSKGIDNLSSLDLVRREEDGSTTQRLNKRLLEMFVSSINDDGNSSSLSLNHNYVEDWALSTKIILLHRECEIDRWYSTPSFEEVKISILSNFLRRQIQQDKFKNELQKIYIKFLTKREDEYECKPVKHFLHGNAKDVDNETYYKIAGKWYKFTSEYSILINQKFSEVIRKLIRENQSLKSLLLPWSHEPKFSLTNVVKFFDLPEAKAQEFMESFEKEIVFTKTSEIKGTFQVVNSWLVESSELVKKLKETGFLTKNKKQESKKFQIEEAISDSSIAKNNLLSDDDAKNLKQILDRRTYLIQKTNTQPTTQSPVWRVINPNVPKHVLETHEISPDQVALFFRSFSKLTENEYNSNYFFVNNTASYETVYGDRVIVKNVEVFDVLIHTDKTTYLLHVKEGFHHNTRDACSQIRMSADLIWNSRRDYQSEKSYIKLFWETAVNYTGTDGRRIALKNKLQKMSQSGFFGFFKRDVQIVFVLAFMDKSKEKLSGSLPIEVDDIKKIDGFQDKADDVRALLQQNSILTDDGYITDAFDSCSKDSFLKKSIDKCGMNKTNIHKLYTFLRKRSFCQIKSTIAKMEILYLNDHFKNYISDDGYKFKLQICQIPSDFASWKM